MTLIFKRLSRVVSQLVVSAIALTAWGVASAGAPANCGQFNIDADASNVMGGSDVSTPVNGECKAQIKNGYPVPDPKCTPGAINPTLTIDVLRDPDFRTGCVRNNVTSEAEKNKTYGWYQIPHPEQNQGVMQVCELDHLISLELGGADSIDNIWPQCGPSRVVLRERYFKQKNAVENFLAKQVRDGVMKLEDAQEGIAKDWTQYLDDALKDCSGQKCR